MKETTVIIKQNCPFNGCMIMAAAELDISRIPDNARAEARAYTRNKLKTALELHHKDGHPKESK